MHRGQSMRKIAFGLALAIAIAVTTPISGDIVKLKNGDVLKGKIIKETESLIKLRIARRGKIVTSFLDKGAIESIDKSSDEVNRKIFKEAGVRNPSRDFAPVYYPGVITAGAAPAGVKPAGRRVAKAGSTRKRGVEGRRDRFKSGFADRFGSKGTPSKAPSSPSTTGSSRSTGTGSSISTGTKSGGMSIGSSSPSTTASAGR